MECRCQRVRWLEDFCLEILIYFLCVDCPWALLLSNGYAPSFRQRPLIAPDADWSDEIKATTGGAGAGWPGFSAGAAVADAARVPLGLLLDHRLHTLRPAALGSGYNHQ